MIHTGDGSWDACVHPAGPGGLGGPEGRRIIAGGEAERSPRCPGPQSIEAPAGRWNRRSPLGSLGTEAIPYTTLG